MQFILRDTRSGREYALKADTDLEAAEKLARRMHGRKAYVSGRLGRFHAHSKESAYMASYVDVTVEVAARYA